MLSKLQPELEHVEAKSENDQKLINKISDKIETLGDLSETQDLGQLVELIQMIEKLNTQEVNTLEPVSEIDEQLDKITGLLDEIDTDQENDVNTLKLKSLTLNAEKLMQNLKLIKSVFDSTEGYTSSEEEDQTYYGISKDLEKQISDLVAIVEKVQNYKEEANFDEVEDFASQISKDITSIEKSLDKHTEVLQKISWKDKLAHRIEELKDAQLDLDDIISDGQLVLADLKKINTAALKAPEENAELLEKLEQHIATVKDSLYHLEEQKLTLAKINDPIQEFEDQINNHKHSEVKQIIKLLRKNKDIKEMIIKARSEIDSLDAKIDNLVEFRDQNIGLIKKKYKAKKGDEIDELIGEFMDTHNADVSIKRIGEGKYMIGDKKISAKVVNGKLLVRVGGGYDTLEAYMKAFGTNLINRTERKAKRGLKKAYAIGDRVKTLGMSGATRVVGSADLKKSFRG